MDTEVPKHQVITSNYLLCHFAYIGVTFVGFYVEKLRAAQSLWIFSTAWTVTFVSTRWGQKCSDTSVEEAAADLMHARGSSLAIVVLIQDISFQLFYNYITKSGFSIFAQHCHELNIILIVISFVDGHSLINIVTNELVKILDFCSKISCSEIQNRNYCNYHS